jgi:hypothetical protein
MPWYTPRNSLGSTLPVRLSVYSFAYCGLWMRVFIVSRGYTRRSTVKAAIAPAFLSCQRYSLPFSIFSWPFSIISKVIPLLFPAFWICPWTDMCVCTCSWRCPMCKQARERVSRKKRILTIRISELVLPDILVKMTH